MMLEMSGRDGEQQKSIDIQREKSWDSALYDMAVADTLPAQPLKTLHELVQKRQNEEVVSEIRKGLGDTDEVHAEMMPHVKNGDGTQEEDADKTVSKISACPSGEKTKVDAALVHQARLLSTLPILEPVASSDVRQSDKWPWRGKIARKASSPSSSNSLRKEKNEENIGQTLFEDKPRDMGLQNPIKTVNLEGLQALGGQQTINLGPDGCIPVEPRLISELETPIFLSVQGHGKAAQRDASHEIRVGEVVAQRYEILSEISRGGYGVVYRARQLGINRIVALKRLRSRQDKSVMQRFLLEADIIKGLIHPNTIQLIDAGVDDNCQFIVMEYIEGQSLRTLLDTEGRLDMVRSIRIARQVLKSIYEAHQKGIIHRDLKPSNILIRNVIGEPDFVKVLDFGIAKARHRKGMRLTQDGKIMGTPRYIAPELLWGEEACPGTDIFAVGLILAEMLTGKPVLPSDPVQAARLATAKTPIVLPSWLQASALGDILRRALEKDPANRYDTAAKMIEDLEGAEAKLAYLRQKKAQSLGCRWGIRPYQVVILGILVIMVNVLLIWHLALQT